MKRLVLAGICAAIVATSVFAEQPKTAPTPTKEDIVYAEKRIKEIDSTLQLLLKELQATPQMTLYNYLTQEKARLQKVLPTPAPEKKK